MNIEKLVGQIYDCIDNEDQWPFVLESIFEELDCSGASFQSFSPETRKTNFSHPIGFDQSWIDEYLKDWYPQDDFGHALISKMLLQ